MLKLDNAIKEHRLLDYIYENEEVDTLSAWSLKKLLKFVLEAVEDNCSAELNDLIMEELKEMYF